MDIHAFTIEAPGVLESIVSRVSVCQADTLCSSIPGLNNGQMDLQALWDTGATNSGISSAMAKRLGLLPIRRAEVEGANGLFTANVYILDITLPNMVSVHNVQVREFVSAGDSDVILGMDIITCGDFAVSNYGRKTVVSFRVPSQKPPIDFRQK